MRSPKMARAFQHYQAGETAQAEAVCLQIVRDDPRQADAWNLLGVLAFQAGNAAAALDYIEHAVAAAPGVASHRSNRGAVLQGLGRFGEAEADFREVLRRSPVDADAHFNLGNVLRDLRRFDEAEASLRRALQLRPAYPDALNNLGNVLRDLRRFDEAEATYRRALQLRPANHEAHTNLGTALRDLGRFREAEGSFRTALKLNPSYAEAMNNLGVLLNDLGRAEEALPLLQRAIDSRPAFAEAHNNVGLALRALGRHAESETRHRRALELRPGHADAHHNLALLMLLRGDFEHGWAEFDWRLQLHNFKVPAYPQPLWDGSPLAGRAILLHCEQGHGDTIQFVRYAPLVKERGGHVVLYCQQRLLDLLRVCPGVDQVVPKDTVAPATDVYVPLLSLPRLFGTTLATIPQEEAYLSPDPALVEIWRQRLASEAGFKVGIVWQGAPKFQRDRFRSAPLAAFEPLAQVPGVRLFSLQVGPGQEQMAELAGSGDPRQARFPVIDLGSRFDPASFSDAAAVLVNLDLLVTVDTAMAHLAGALGVPAWVALPFAPDWRWLLEREDSPWYPTLRLFRQTRLGEWGDVFARMARELTGIARQY